MSMCCQSSTLRSTPQATAIGAPRQRPLTVLARAWFRISLISLISLVSMIMGSTAHGQRTVAITGDRLSGIVLPIEPIDGDIHLSALRGWVWTVDDTQRLVLEEDVTITIGGNELRAKSATVWINRIPSAEGLINQVAVYYDEARNPSRRAGTGAEGRDLLVTGSSRGVVRLEVARLEHDQPRVRGIVDRGEARLARHLQHIVGGTPRLARRPLVDTPPPPDADILIPGGQPDPPPLDLPTSIELPSESATLPLLAPRGMVRWSAGSIEHSTGEQENVITATGSLVVEYVASVREQDWSQLTLAAQRGVIFTRPGAGGDPVQLDAQDIYGIYLEGNVRISADDGDYVARAPRVFYDFRTQRAVMVDAVLRTYARDSNIPIYARAKELRQVAANQWEANEVRVSTSEFFAPHLAIGARRMTLTRQPTHVDPTRRETLMVSEGNQLLVSNQPIFSWPKFSGTIKDIPIKRVTVGTRENDGLRVKTRWDLYALTGREAPKGVEAELLVDGFTERGAAAGLNYSYQDSEQRGLIDIYALYDSGTDRTTAGREIDHHGDLRGVALFEHTARLSRDWTLQAQASLISDETFINAWRERDFIEGREYETSGYLKQQYGGGAMTLLTQYSLNDFISNDYLLASRQYIVDKLPEVTFRRYGEDWFDGKAVYSGETRVSRMRLAFENHSPNQLGLPAAAFGVSPDDNLRDVLRQSGLPQEYVSRFDTRHELSVPLDYGPVRVTPFGVARLTAYNDDFESFSSEADSSRFFGAIGVRINTQLQHIDNSVTSLAFDLNRMRHILEPSATVWWSSANISEEDLPTYDEEVESLGTGAAVRLGLRSTWQTQRGGPGRWRSVDYLTLNSDVVFTSNDTNRESPSPQFFDYRPEYSQFGDHINTSMAWLLSDNVSIVGENTWDLDNSLAARSSIGAEVRHNPVLSTYVEYRFLDASENELLDLGWKYRLTPVYRVNFNPQWDFEVNEFRSLTFRVTRAFPDFDFAIQVRHDDIADDTTIGASIDLATF